MFNIHTQMHTDTLYPPHSLVVQSFHQAVLTILTCAVGYLPRLLCDCKCEEWSCKWHLQIKLDLCFGLFSIYVITASLPRKCEKEDNYAHPYLTLCVHRTRIKRVKSRLTAGWSDGSELTFECYSQFQISCFSSPLTAGLD